MIEKSNETIKQTNLYEPDDVVSIIRGYQSLNYDGKMKKFLHSASSCPKCKELRPQKRPINRLINALELDNSPEEEANRQIKRYDHFKEIFDRHSNSPVEKFSEYTEDEQFYKYVTGDQWPITGGLSIGVCGWTDASILLSKGKHEIMIVAADWYPMRAQTTFIIEREDRAFLKYMKFLDKLFPGNIPEDKTEKWSNLLSIAGVYFTNAMLCYRAQTDKVGQKNISAKSFEYCQNHLKDQINIVKPKLIVTWGVHPAIYTFNVLSEIAQNEIAEDIKKIFLNPFRLTKLGTHPEKPPFKIHAEWGDVWFHPICHPSMPQNRWGKQSGGQYLDYGNLGNWIKTEYNIY